MLFLPLVVRATAAGVIIEFMLPPDIMTSKMKPTVVPRSAETQAILDRAAAAACVDHFTVAGEALAVARRHYRERGTSRKSISPDDVPALRRQSLSDFILVSEHVRRLARVIVDPQTDLATRALAKKRQTQLRHMVARISRERTIINAIRPA